MQPRKGIVLFGHGSRDPLWRQPMEAVAARLLSAQPELLVCCGYLELDQPDLETAVAQLIGQGATAISILPMFLGTGKHAREDLPVLVEKLRQGYVEVPFKLLAPIGEDRRVLDLLASIAME